MYSFKRGGAELARYHNRPSLMSSFLVLSVMVFLLVFELVFFLTLLSIGRVPGCVDAELTSVLAPKRRPRVAFAPEMVRLRQLCVRCGRKTAMASAPTKSGGHATRPILKRKTKMKIIPTVSASPHSIRITYYSASPRLM